MRKTKRCCRAPSGDGSTDQSPTTATTQPSSRPPTLTPASSKSTLAVTAGPDTARFDSTNTTVDQPGELTSGRDGQRLDDNHSPPQPPSHVHLSQTITNAAWFSTPPATPPPAVSTHTMHIDRVTVVEYEYEYEYDTPLTPPRPLLHDKPQMETDLPPHDGDDDDDDSSKPPEDTATDLQHVGGWCHRRNPLDVVVAVARPHTHETKRHYYDSYGHGWYHDDDDLCLVLDLNLNLDVGFDTDVNMDASVDVDIDINIGMAVAVAVTV